MQNGPLTEFMTNILGNEIPEFILSVAICFLAVYLFPALWNCDSKGKKKGSFEPRTATAEVIVPAGLTGKVSQLLDLSSLAALSSTSSSQHQQFWQSPEAWAPKAASIGVTEKQIGGGEGDVVREAFRRRLFHVDATYLASLRSRVQNIKKPEDRASILNDLTKMVQGMTLDDDEALMEGVCDLAVRILQMHDGSDSQPAEAAARFVQAMQRCGSDVFTSAQFDRVELAWESALQLDALMETAVHRFYSELPAVRAEGAGCCSSEAMLDSEYEAMHETAFLAGH